MEKSAIFSHVFFMLFMGGVILIPPCKGTSQLLTQVELKSVFEYFVFIIFFFIILELLIAPQCSNPE